MSPQNIRADYDQLEQIAGSLRGESEVMDASVRELNARLQVLQGGEWLGDAATRFYGEMDDAVMPALNRLVNALLSGHDVMLNVSQRMHTAEDEAERAIRSGTAQDRAQSASDDYGSDKDTEGDGNSLSGLLLDAGLSFAPVVGDGLDILKQGWNALTGQPVDAPVLAMSIAGLAADLGWLDGPVPDPVDGVNAVLATGKAIVKRIPPGPARDAFVDLIETAVKNPSEVTRLSKVFTELASHGDVVEALGKYPQGAVLLLKNGPEMVEYLAKNGDGAGTVFADGRKFAEHVFKHADEMGFENAAGYLESARKLTTSTSSDVLRHSRANGDELFYNQATNEFAVLTKDGKFRTYYEPKDGLAYWQEQIIK